MSKITTDNPSAQEFEHTNHEPYKLYASAETTKRLGWIAERITHWAGMNVLIITPVDKDHERKVIEGFPNLQNRDDIDIDNLVKLASFSGTHALKTAEYKLYNLHIAEDLCVIHVDSQIMNSDHNVIASQLLGIAPKYMKNIPGTDMDWKSIAIAHETAHCSQKPTKTQIDFISNKNTVSISQKNIDTLQDEINADMTAIEIYEQEYKAGNTTSPDVPQTMINLRRIASVMPLASETHITGYALGIPGKILPLFNDASTVTKNINEIRTNQSENSPLTQIKNYLKKLFNQTNAHPYEQAQEIISHYRQLSDSQCKKDPICNKNGISTSKIKIIDDFAHAVDEHLRPPEKAQASSPVSNNQYMHTMFDFFIEAKI